MPGNIRKTYKYIRRRLYSRHNYGFGVHSPFVYYFTKFVVYEKHPFYVFADIEAEQRRRGVMLPPKYGRLLYRVARFGQCRSMLIAGDPHAAARPWLQAACPQAECVQPDSAAMPRGGEVDLLYIGEGSADSDVPSYMDYLTRYGTGKTILVMARPHRSPETERRWLDIGRHPRITVSIDLWHVGIAFLNPDLHRKTYYMMI